MALLEIDLARRVIPGAHSAGTERLAVTGVSRRRVGSLRALSARHSRRREAACARRAPIERDLEHLSILSTQCNSMCFLSESGNSSKSGSFCFGALTCLMPKRLSGDRFLTQPPIGRTRPVSVISPVIAVSARTRRPVTSDTSAVAIVMPALGPSFGTAPAGTCTCRSLCGTSPRRRTHPSASGFAFRYERAAAADSFITSPSWPVICILPSPG